MKLFYIYLFLALSIYANTARGDVLFAEHDAQKYFREIERLQLPDPLSQIFYLRNIFEMDHLLLPADGRISSYFGSRKDPITHDRRFHSGVDFANLKRSGIHAAAAGKVKYSGKGGGCGLVVEIAHDGGLITRYCHLDRTLAKTGDVVSAGEVIGLMGDTGRATGSHLHFEVIKNGQPIDPAKKLVF